MHTNQIPPGIIAFKVEDSLVHQWSHPYDTFVRDWLYNEEVQVSFHTISVDGTEWSVGQYYVIGNGSTQTQILEFIWSGSEWLFRDAFGKHSFSHISKPHPTKTKSDVI